MSVGGGDPHLGTQQHHHHHYYHHAFRHTLPPLSSSFIRRGKAFQGNLDPCELFGSPASIQAGVRAMLVGFGDAPLIGNLGHGMMPSHSPDALRTFFTAVQTVSAEMRAGR